MRRFAHALLALTLGLLGVGFMWFYAPSAGGDAPDGQSTIVDLR